MKGAHYRRRPLGSNVEKIIFIFGMALFGTGIGIAASDAHPDSRVSSITPLSTTTTEAMTTTLVGSTDVTETTLVLSKPKPAAMRPVAAHSAPSTVPETTTTTTAPKTPLEVALSQLGKTGPYADGGFWCAKFVSWTAEQAHVPGFISRDGPSALYADAVADGRLTQEPVIGGMIFIDLFGPDGVGHGQVTHVGIVEYVDGSTVGIVQGNGKPDPTVITRTTYELGSGYIVGFAPFSKGDK